MRFTAVAVSIAISERHLHSRLFVVQLQDLKEISVAPVIVISEVGIGVKVAPPTLTPRFRDW